MEFFEEQEVAVVHNSDGDTRGGSGWNNEQEGRRGMVTSGAPAAVADNNRNNGKNWNGNDGEEVEEEGAGDDLDAILENMGACV